MLPNWNVSCLHQLVGIEGLALALCSCSSPLLADVISVKHARYALYIFHNILQYPCFLYISRKYSVAKIKWVPDVFPCLISFAIRKFPWFETVQDPCFMKVLYPCIMKVPFWLTTHSNSAYLSANLDFYPFTEIR